MNKELVYQNISKIINDDFFLDKYIELTTNIIDEQFESDDFLTKLDLAWDLSANENKDNDQIEEFIDSNEVERKKIEQLEKSAANLFNAVLIGCQLFDDEKRIKKFIDMFSYGLFPDYLESVLPNFGISKQEAMDRLNHGFVVHFTTPNIFNEIKKKNKLIGYGKNGMFTEQECVIIENAEKVQKANDPTASQTLNYLFTGWGAGVSSYGSITNGFWMYHTPESLTFLYEDISMRNKEEAMKSVLRKISSLNEVDKKIVYETMNNIYDRLVGEEQAVGCVLIDRDAFDYEVDYYYNTGKAVGVERRPFSQDFYSLMISDCAINKDIDVCNLKFLKIPTIAELERQKKERIKEEKNSRKM